MVLVTRICDHDSGYLVNSVVFVFMRLAHGNLDVSQSVCVLQAVLANIETT